MQIISAGMNPVQISHGIEKTAKALVSELKMMSREVREFVFLHLSHFEEYICQMYIGHAIKIMRSKRETI